MCKLFLGDIMVFFANSRFSIPICKLGSIEGYIFSPA